MVVATDSYDAFGNPVAHTGAASSAFGFTGNWTDPSTGLVHLRARDYDPKTGQFLTVDPAVDSTRQPYAYTGNSPVGRTDPTGLFFWDDIAREYDNFRQDLAAAGMGMISEATGGASDVLFGEAIPGYDCFIAEHQEVFEAGQAVAVVAEIAVAVVSIVASAGGATGFVVAAAAAKIAIKATTKALVAGVKRAVASVAERAAVAGRRMLLDDTGSIGFGAARKSPSDLSDDLILVRGGENLPANFSGGTGVVTHADGTLSRVSVSSGRTLDQAAAGFRNNQIGASTVGDVRAAGGTVTPNPTRGNPGHCVIDGCTAQELSSIFTPTLTNVWK